MLDFGEEGSESELEEVDETMSAFVRADQSGLVIVWCFVTTGVSAVDGGGGSTVTVSEDEDFV